jgi:hypothetical protein
MYPNAKVYPSSICEQCHTTWSVTLFTYVSILYCFLPFSLSKLLSSSSSLRVFFSGFSSLAAASGFRWGRRLPSSSCSINNTFRRGRLHYLLVPLSLLRQICLNLPWSVRKPLEALERTHREREIPAEEESKKKLKSCTQSR